ncbi:CdaR family protein [Desulfuromonas acetexigens]|uniref:YbbR-like domain-containing protein n=1 Tax=Trichloromonas acetexigens TaxID=38815 RepID=A0A550JJB9_9BACT|nr:CdaR family protein [Desulfuromonas acetexigens]TRO83311.1 YbbR-like domain-containing protein [Desulfuromonas acetexigens]
MFRRLTENLFLKLLSLAFALILWFFVMGEQKQELSYAVPLAIKNLPANLMVANEIPSQVDVRISGPRTLLMNLDPKDMGIAVDLRGLQPGVTSFRRLEELFNLPGALKITRLSPSFVDVRLERIKDKKVPVKLVISGAPAPGFELREIQLAPAEVLVEGAEGELKNVAQAETDPVEIEGVRDSFSLIVPIDYRGRYTYLKEDRTVEVHVTIVKLPEPEIPAAEVIGGEQTGEKKE